MNYSLNSVDNVPPVGDTCQNEYDDLSYGQVLLLEKLLTKFDEQVDNQSLKFKNLASIPSACIIAPASKEG